MGSTVINIHAPDHGVAVKATVDNGGLGELVITPLNGGRLNGRFNVGEVVAWLNTLPLSGSTAQVKPAKPARKTVTAKASAPAEAPVKPAKTARKTAAPKAKPSAEVDGPKRAYRKMPEDFASTLRQVGKNYSVLMDEYKAPRHTINNWIRNVEKAATEPAAEPATADAT